MVKLVLVVIKCFAFFFLSGIDFHLSLKDSIFAEAYSSQDKKQSESIASSGSVVHGIDITNVYGIYRGEASPSSPERIDQLSEAAHSYGSSRGDTNNADLTEPASCAEDTERLLILNEDIRLELSAIDIEYLENGSIQNACKRDGQFSNCKFDFRLIPNELQKVCEKHGGSFDETEHSIQCHNPSTKESLYYQFDHDPSCFSVVCEKTDTKQLVTERINSISQRMSEYLEMSCFADDDILRYANGASSIEPASSCAEDTERLLILNEDIRLELSAIDVEYLENASIQNVCKRDGQFSNCKFDFRLFPNELQKVCEKHGGSFDETEHSIQCHNPSTKESLYYQFDHDPSCFSVVCEKTDTKQLVTERINSISQRMSEYLEMSCFADDDILRYANGASSIEPASSCAEDTERLLILNEDIRLELSAIDIEYLENASIQNVCKRDGQFSNCKFDFRLFPNELQKVCEKHGGSFDETEHSIQCHNPSTKESLYYQFDHYPSCFSEACEKTDANQLVAEQIKSISQSMSEYLEMSCFADDDILRYANGASSMESSGMKRSWHGIQIFPVAAFLLTHFN